MQNNNALILVLAKGVAFIADRSDVPRQTTVVPYSTADLQKRPPAELNYEEIDRLVTNGLAEIGKPYNSCSSVYLTYAGHVKRLELTGWMQQSYTRWKTQYAKYLCCAKAIPGNCVCLVMTRCPDHGTRCNGSHD